MNSQHALFSFFSSPDQHYHNIVPFRAVPMRARNMIYEIFFSIMARCTLKSLKNSFHALHTSHKYLIHLSEGVSEGGGGVEVRHEKQILCGLDLKKSGMLNSHIPHNMLKYTPNERKIKTLYGAYVCTSSSRAFYRGFMKYSVRMDGIYVKHGIRMEIEGRLEGSKCETSKASNIKNKGEIGFEMASK